MVRSAPPSDEIPVPKSLLPVEVKPAAHVWTQPAPTTLREQVEFFNREGFLHIPGVLNRAELSELDRELDRMVRDYKTLPRIREGFSGEPVADPRRTTPTFRKIGGISDLSDAFARHLRNKRTLDIVHAILGPEIYLYRDVVMMKPARVGREKPWHQDSVYWPFRPMNLISASTALDDASPENGCLQVVPRSHTQELQHYGGELRIDMTADLRARTYYLPLKAGDTLLFHSLILHGSEPNRSEQDRRLLIYSLMGKGLEFVGQGDRPETPLVSKRS